MNLFNRIVVVLLLLLVIVLAFVAMFLPLGPLDFIIGWLTFIKASLYVPTNYLIVILVSLVVILLSLLLLWLEFRGPARPKTVRIEKVGGGYAEVTTDSIAQRLKYRVDQLVGVTEVKPIVTSRGKVVDVVLDLETSPDIEVPAKTEEVCQVAREEVEQKMGLKLDRIRVNIRHAPYPPKTETPPAVGSRSP
jgi:membrane protein implicated in regulation of membrane protease activity